MRNAATAVVLIALLAAPAAAAQGKGKKNGKIPPGHLPAAGQCRVWYEGVPPGHQPPATSCAEAERIAARDRYARVIYGSERGRKQRDDDRYGREIPRSDRYPAGDPYPDSRNPDSRYPDSRYPDSRYPDSRYPDGRYPDSRYPDQYPDQRGRYRSAPFENGRRDGLVKGREDARDRDSYDPARHSWYRAGDRGYNNRYGSREEYRAAYREGFLAGYEQAYGGGYAGAPSRSRRPSWWPF